jgi:hypothetical protein
MKVFHENNKEIAKLLKEWEPRLLSLSNDTISNRRNIQNRTIREILGHLCDSASNNTHRIVHLQYQESPLNFPDYANLGNNDRWIAIQNFQNENWNDLVHLWKYMNLHLMHVITKVNEDKLDNVWISALKQEVPLKNMIIDYLRHLKLHLAEIEELIHVS